MLDAKDLNRRFVKIGHLHSMVIVTVKQSNPCQPFDFTGRAVFGLLYSSVLNYTRVQEIDPAQHVFYKKNDSHSPKPFL